MSLVRRSRKTWSGAQLHEDHGLGARDWLTSNESFHHGGLPAIPASPTCSTSTASPASPTVQPASSDVLAAGRRVPPAPQVTSASSAVGLAWEVPFSRTVKRSAVVARRHSCAGNANVASVGTGAGSGGGAGAAAGGRRSGAGAREAAEPRRSRADGDMAAEVCAAAAAVGCLASGVSQASVGVSPPPLPARQRAPRKAALPMFRSGKPRAADARRRQVSDLIRALQPLQSVPPLAAAGGAAPDIVLYAPHDFVALLAGARSVRMHNAEVASRTLRQLLDADQLVDVMVQFKALLHTASDTSRLDSCVASFIKLHHRLWALLPPHVPLQPSISSQLPQPCDQQPQQHSPSLLAPAQCQQCPSTPTLSPVPQQHPPNSRPSLSSETRQQLPPPSPLSSSGPAPSAATSSQQCSRNGDADFHHSAASEPSQGHFQSLSLGELSASLPTLSVPRRVQDDAAKPCSPVRWSVHDNDLFGGIDTNSDNDGSSVKGGSGAGTPNGGGSSRSKALLRAWSARKEAAAASVAAACSVLPGAGAVATADGGALGAADEDAFQQDGGGAGRDRDETRHRRDQGDGGREGSPNSANVVSPAAAKGLETETECHGGVWRSFRAAGGAADGAGWDVGASAAAVQDFMRCVEDWFCTFAEDRLCRCSSDVAALDRRRATALLHALDAARAWALEQLAASRETGGDAAAANDVSAVRLSTNSGDVPIREPSSSSTWSGGGVALDQSGTIGDAQPMVHVPPTVPRWLALHDKLAGRCMELRELLAGRAAKAGRAVEPVGCGWKKPAGRAGGGGKGGALKRPQLRF